MKQNKFQKGFTLIELIVVMFMTALIATVMLANFRGGEKVKRVQLVVDGVTNTTRLAQNYTLTGKQLQQSTGCNGNNSVNYYGVSLVGGAVSVPLSAEDKCGSPVVVDTYNFLTGTRIKANGIDLEICNPSCATTTVNSLWLRFSPPFGVMSVSTNNGATYSAFSKADITIENTDGSIFRTFRIDGVAGRIGN